MKKIIGLSYIQIIDWYRKKISNKSNIQNLTYNKNIINNNLKKEESLNQNSMKKENMIENNNKINKFKEENKNPELNNYLLNNPNIC